MRKVLRSILVKNQTLSMVAKDLGFSKFQRYLPTDSPTEKARQNVLSDSFEAFLGALYLDKNLTTVETLLKVVLFPRLQHKSLLVDPKTSLQHRILSITKNRKYSPVYKYMSKH